MFVSPREAADLGLQIAIALALTVSGMAIASSATGGEKIAISALDVSRPSLWTAVPMRINPATQAAVWAGARGKMNACRFRHTHRIVLALMAAIVFLAKTMFYL